MMLLWLPLTPPSSPSSLTPTPNLAHPRPQPSLLTTFLYPSLLTTFLNPSLISLSLLSIPSARLPAFPNPLFGWLFEGGPKFAKKSFFFLSEFFFIDVSILRVGYSSITRLPPSLPGKQISAGLVNFLFHHFF